MSTTCRAFNLPATTVAIIASPDRQLVRNHLRGRTDSTEQRPAIVRSPSAERHSVDPDTERGHHVECGNAGVGGLQVDSSRADFQYVSDRHHRKGDEHREKRQKWRQAMEKAVRAVGYEIFLGEQLDRVGQRCSSYPGVGSPRRRPTPKIAARFAPIRSWISALPLRSNHSSRPDRLSTIRTTTIALIALIKRSIATFSELVDQLRDRVLGQIFVISVMVKLEHRRGRARRHAFDCAQGEHSVIGRFAQLNREFLGNEIDNSLGAAQPAGQVIANLQMKRPTGAR